MKKLIGMIVILLTLILSVIYRQLTARQVREKQPQAYITAALREGMTLSYLLLQ
jgi:cell division protein FtsL